MKLRNISRNVKSILWLTAIGVLGVVSSAVYATTFSDLNEENKNLVKNSQVSKNPLNIAATQIPTFVMIVLGRDHNLFTEAYNDYTDLNDDETLDIFFDPSIDYYGIFDSSLCYQYSGCTTSDDKKCYLPEVDNSSVRDEGGYFYPSKIASSKEVSLSIWNNESRTVNVCPGAGLWSGNFLNYVTSSRLDVIRKVLYGGTRLNNAAWLGGSGVGSASTSTLHTTYRDGSTYGAVLLKHSNVLRDSHSWGKVFSPIMYEDKLSYDDFLGESNSVSGTGAVFLGMTSYDDTTGDYNKTRAGLMRVGWVHENAGKPGVPSTNNQTFIWDWVSTESSDGMVNENSDLFKNQTTKDYQVHVAVCTKDFHNDESCYNYGTQDDPIWRPIGILQQYEINAQSAIKFGLITGSWEKNTSSGALRANIGDFAKEIASSNTTPAAGGRNPGDFIYKGVGCAAGTLCGFVSVLDQMRIVGKTDGSSGEYSDCTRESAGTFLNPSSGISDGNCKDWGNPVAKLLNQAADYFANTGKSGDPITPFADSLSLGSVSYQDPYAGDNYYCANSVSIVIADENISFDGTMDTNAKYAISNEKTAETSNIKVSGSYLMGYSSKEPDSVYNYLPTVKAITDLSQVGGIAPTAAQNYGSYNVAGIAKYCAKNNFFTATSTKDPNVKQSHNMQTYVVAMKPNVPEIKIPLDGGNYATIVPIAVSLDYSSSGLSSYNQVVDFYVEQITDTSGIFRVNYEDYQYGSDYDMDWIVEYKYKVLTDSANNKYIRVQLRDVSGDGYANQRAGYVITGVTNNGVYFDLEKPSANAKGSDEDKPEYALDNPIQDITIINCLSNDKSVGSGGNLNTECLGVKDSSLNGISGGCFRSKVNIIPGDTFDSTAIALYESNIDANIANFWSYINSIKDDYYKNRQALGYTDLSPIEQRKSSKALTGHSLRCKEWDGISASSRVFKVDSANGNDVWLKSPLWYAAQYGLDLDQTSLPANQDPINYFLVTNPSKLKEGITRMLEQIKKSVHSASSFSTESTSTQAGDFVYATQYEPATWWGEVIKTTITSSDIDFGGYSEFNDTNIQWKASEQFENAKIEDRLVVALNENHELTRIYADDFKSAYDSLGEDLFETISGQTLNGADPSEDLDKYMTRFVRWYLGEHDYENSGSSNNEDLVYGSYNDGLPLRSRISSFGSFVLGDVIDSDAVMFTSNGKKFVVVGANDGMLHFIDAANGKPVLSYVPTVMLPDIKNLAKQDWVKTHTYMVNSTPRIYYKGDKVYIYGTYGVAYPGGYALDVTDLSTLSSTSVGDSFKVLWELKPSDSSMVGNMPYPPSIMSVGTDDYLIYSSGYPTSDVAFKNGIFVVDMFNKDSCINQKDGESMDNKACIIKEISLDKGYYRKDNGDLNEETVSDPWGIGRKNAIGPVSLVQLNATLNTYEAIYAGDYFGNLWKIDINGKEIDVWEKPTILFKAVDNSGTAQPITARIGVGHVNNGVMLIFGTGSYVRDIDNQQVSKDYNDYQSIYAIRDMTTMYSASSLNNELKRCGAEGTSENAPCLSKVESDGATGSSVTNADGSTSISYLREFKITKGSPNVGWFLDLGGRATSEKGESVPNTGERVYTDPLIIGTDAYLTINIPNVDDPCLGAGVSSIFRTSLLTGVVQEVAKYESLAKSPTVTIHEGDIVIHVPLDPVGHTNPDGGDPQVENIKLNSLPSKHSSIIKLY